MQAIIFADNDNVFKRIGGLSVLERHILSLVNKDVVKIFIISLEKDKIGKAIGNLPKNISSDFEIVPSFCDALKLSFMDGYIVNENVVYKERFLEINDKTQCIKLSKAKIFYVPYKILKKIADFEDIFDMSKEISVLKEDFIMIENKKSGSLARKFLINSLNNKHDDLILSSINALISKIIARIYAKLSFPVFSTLFVSFITGFFAVFLLFCLDKSVNEVVSSVIFYFSTILFLSSGKYSAINFKNPSKSDFFDRIFYEINFFILIASASMYSYLTYYYANAYIVIITGLTLLLFIVGKLIARYNENESPLEIKVKKSVFFVFCKSFFTISSASLIMLFFALFKVFWLITFFAFVISLLFFIINFIVLLAFLSKGRKIKKTYKNIKACLFDFDGTLVDDMQEFADLAALTMGKYYGISFKLARKRYVDLTGIPFVQQINAILPGAEKNNEAVEYFETNKEDIFFNKNVEEDVKNTLVWLKEKGLKIAVSSGGFKEMIDKFCEKEGIEFDEVLGFSENFEKGPDHFKYLLDTFNIDKDELLFCGDSLKDAKKGLDFGIKFIAVTGTFTKERFKEKFNNIEIVDGIYELKKILG